MQAHPPATSEAAPAADVTPPRPGKAKKAATKAGRPTTLLDVEEVEWITRELERLLAREQSGGEGGDDGGADGRHHHRRKRTKLSPAPKKGGFLAELIGRHAASICSGDDAVDRSAAAAAAGVDRRGRRRGGRGGFREVEKV